MQKKYSLKWLQTAWKFPTFLNPSLIVFLKNHSGHHNHRVTRAKRQVPSMMPWQVELRQVGYSIFRMFHSHSIESIQSIANRNGVNTYLSYLIEYLG